MNHETNETFRQPENCGPVPPAGATPAAAPAGPSLSLGRRLACAVRINRTTGDITIRAGSACAKMFGVAIVVLLIGTVAFVRTVTRTSSAPELASSEMLPIGAAGDRISGLNYLILKSCPTEEEAIAVRDAMVAKGVPCTIERALADWTSKGWYSVVGTSGFHVTTAPEYKQHVAALQSLKVDPKPYKWRPQQIMTASAE